VVGQRWRTAEQKGGAPARSVQFDQDQPGQLAPRQTEGALLIGDHRPLKLHGAVAGYMVVQMCTQQLRR
jgi:hypothetical protein